MEKQEDQVGVELGYLEEQCESWKLQSRFFPSKVGGKPAWVRLDSVPDADQLQCRKCGDPTIFLLQLYAPFDGRAHIPAESVTKNFHRSLFVFICKNPDCCIRNNSDNVRVFRSSLPRKNKFYPFEPPDDIPDPLFSMENWTRLCRVCGCYASKKCSRCRVADYCSRTHQVHDWKYHKKECGSILSERLSPLLFPEWEIITEAEELDDVQSTDKDELWKFEKLKLDDGLGSMANVPENELEKYAESEEDTTFRKFQDRVKQNPDQIIRYQKNGTPLWIAKQPLPEKIPDCEHCGGPRRFEFQVMPQLLTFLHENTLDFGVLVVYTCEASCDDDGKYKEEFVFKQDVEVPELEL
ncbi:unnamed protein product [Acanthoscelides obtectus]|uniref:MYND-type domain-containing protein n=1 Tax=Acanthoscelides obtectus TaxID=200917 RepID=A0A9P0KCY0_ACAOB|nr:unnamed protein product [Acanthoscelides obtectus]CAK1629335.1 Programmed cell death protein 2 [Acanthoscelides obtectus]